jgi:uncharacterized protein (DUF433 family)/DNA-binding transcriptional MerR regulator
VEKRLAGAHAVEGRQNYSAAMSDAARMPPRGRYLAWQAGQLAGVSGNTVGQWARRGYVRSSVRSSAPRVYGFQDVAEAMVVHELLDRGVPHGEIRQAIRRLEEEYGSWPLTQAPLATVAGAGRRPDERRARVVLRADGADYDVGGLGWQQVLEPQSLDAIRGRLARGGWAVRALPDLEHIEVDPDRLSGRPAIRGRRIAAQDVAEIAADPGGVELLRRDYDLTAPQIADAGRWWREVRRLEAEAS